MSNETASEVMLARIERLVRDKVEDERRIAELLIREDTLEGTIREIRVERLRPRPEEPGVVVCSDCRKCKHVCVGQNPAGKFTPTGCFLARGCCQLHYAYPRSWLTTEKCDDFALASFVKGGRE